MGAPRSVEVDPAVDAVELGMIERIECIGAQLKVISFLDLCR